MNRDQIAAMALQGLLSNPENQSRTSKEYATYAVKVADALIVALTPVVAKEEDSSEAVLSAHKTCGECRSDMRILENIYQKDDGEMFHCPPSVPVHYKLVAREFICDVCNGIPF